MLLYVIAMGQPEWTPGGFASNGYGAHVPKGYGLLAALLIEVIRTAGFLIIIPGATSPGAPLGFAPIASEPGLTLLNLIWIPITGTSVDPARSTAVAFLAETGASGQLRLFWVAPLAWAALGALFSGGLLGSAKASETAPRQVGVA